LSGVLPTRTRRAVGRGAEAGATGRGDAAGAEIASGETFPLCEDAAAARARGAAGYAGSTRAAGKTPLSCAIRASFEPPKKLSTSWRGVWGGASSGETLAR